MAEPTDAAGRPSPLEIHARNVRAIIAAAVAAAAVMGACTAWTDAQNRAIAACQQLERDEVVAHCLDGVAP